MLVHHSRRILDSRFGIKGLGCSTLRGICYATTMSPLCSNLCSRSSPFPRLLNPTLAPIKNVGAQLIEHPTQPCSLVFVGLHHCTLKSFLDSLSYRTFTEIFRYIYDITAAVTGSRLSQGLPPKGVGPPSARPAQFGTS